MQRTSNTIKADFLSETPEACRQCLRRSNSKNNLSQPVEEVRAPPDSKGRQRHYRGKKAIYRPTFLLNIDTKILNKKYQRGLPWWHSGWESACQCRGQGFKPWSGRFPHAAEQRSPCATTTEPALWSPQATVTGAACLEPVLHNKKSHRDEKPTHGNEE